MDQPRPPPARVSGGRGWSPGSRWTTPCNPATSEPSSPWSTAGRRADDPDGPAGFADRGREIAVYADRDRDAVRAALQLAAQKWGRFRVEGDADYRALCVELAAEGGFSLGDPDLQDALRRAKAESAARAAPRPAADRRAGPSP